MDEGTGFEIRTGTCKGTGTGSNPVPGACCGGRVWLKARSWKGRPPSGGVGSNPTRSACRDGRVAEGTGLLHPTAERRRRFESCSRRWDPRGKPSPVKPEHQDDLVARKRSRGSPSYCMGGRARSKAPGLRPGTGSRRRRFESCPMHSPPASVAEWPKARGSEPLPRGGHRWFESSRMHSGYRSRV